MAGTGVGKFSSTAGSNTANMTVNFAENMAPSNVNNAARELMGHMRDMYEQLGDGYFEFGDGDGTYTVARGDADTITITSASDISSVYFPGRKIRITDGGANVVEGTIASSSHASTTQTVNLTGISLAAGTPTKVELGIDTAAFGGRVILDDDGDTYIEAPTDDTIDIYVAGAKDFVITANTFTAESGSTIAAQALTATTGAFTDNVTMTTADNTAQLTLTSTDTDANSGPRLDFIRNPGEAGADADFLSAILHRGYNDATELTTFAEINAQIVDASNGSEDGRFYINTMVAGTGTSRMEFTPTETVFNEGSADLDFRVESNGNANMLFVDGGNNAVKIGHSEVVNMGGSAHGLIVGSNDGSLSRLGIFRSTANAFSSTMDFMKSRNATSGGNTIVNDGDNIGLINFFADDGTDFASEVAAIQCVIDGTPGENDTPGALIFKTTADGAALSSTRMRIDSAGKVGIGTASPSYPLHVSAAVNDVVSALENTATSGNVYGHQIVFSSTANDTSSYFFRCVGNNQSTVRAAIYSNGDFQSATNSYGATSDERIKQNITDANSQWDDIKGLRVRNFKFKDEVRTEADGGQAAKTYLGLVAQETETVSAGLVKSIDPEKSDILSSSEFGTLYTSDDAETQDAVLYTSDDQEVIDGDKNVGDIKTPSTKQIGEVKTITEQVKSVSYSVLYMKAIKALQEAMTRIETLETKVAALEG